MSTGLTVHCGWCELVDLPAWGITRLRAKADTGARTSSLHVENLVELPHRRVAFEVILHRRRVDRRVRVEAPVVRTSRVKSSNGVSSLRHVVRTTILIGPVEREIELNLVDRGEMIHRMLLGRSALSGMVVEVDSQYLLGRRPRRKKGRGRV
jgi:hypothetical protein